MHRLAPAPARLEQDLYFFLIVKEQPITFRPKARAKRASLGSAFCPLPLSGGADRDRTDDPLLAKQVLSQLSYSPVSGRESRRALSSLVGLDGFEPSTPALSRRCSNQLTYRPVSDRADFARLCYNR